MACQQELSVNETVVYKTDLKLISEIIESIEDSEHMGTLHSVTAGRAILGPSEPLFPVPNKLEDSWTTRTHEPEQWRRIYTH